MDRRGYFAIARVAWVIEDPDALGMHIAVIEPGTYIDFTNPVPFNDVNGVLERGVLNAEGRLSGRARSAVRPISPSDFNRVIQFTSRIVRDRVFRRLVLDAYDKRCAITGLKLINCGGRAEVDAAHIRKVEANAPDTLANGMISLSDDLQVLISRRANDPESIRSLINQTGKAIVPQRSAQRPHPHFLRWHRENCLKR